MLVDFSRLLSPSRKALLFQFIRFGMVGVAGFVVDTAIVYGLRGWLGLYGAGLASYLLAATTTWALNRIWTFRGRGTSTAIHRQWALFLAANGLGFILNRGAYFVLITISPLCVDYPVLAILGGVAAGMFVNFYLSRQLVFR
jgi:putative flippase GtrA